jgi:hypothetical protein
MVTSDWGPWEGAEPGNDRWCLQTSDGCGRSVKGCGPSILGALRQGVGRRAPTRALTDGALRPGVGRRAPTRAMTNGDIRLVRGRALTPAMTDGALRPVMGQRVRAMGQRVQTTHSQRRQTWVGRRAPTWALTDGALRPGVGLRAPTRVHDRRRPQTGGRTEGADPSNDRR